MCGRRVATYCRCIMHIPPPPPPPLVRRRCTYMYSDNYIHHTFPCGLEHILSLRQLGKETGTAINYIVCSTNVYSLHSNLMFSKLLVNFTATDNKGLQPRLHVKLIHSLLEYAQWRQIFYIIICLWKAMSDLIHLYF